jgi:tetratricopeptide (TPR) repeat protein
MNIYMACKSFWPKKIFLLTLCIAALLTCSAQRNEILVKLVKEGMALHDKGDYEAAIIKYDKALILDPNDFDANYEKSASLLYSGKYDESIAISIPLIENYKNNPAVKGAYVNLGSAYDDKGNTDSAIIIYNQGIKQFPDFYLLHFNKGLTYARQKKWDDAYGDFYKSLSLKPTHAGSLYYISLLEEKTNKVVAIISGLAFLAIEPEGKRAKSIYGYVFDLLNSYVKKNDDGGSTITLSLSDSKEKENNFSTVEMSLAISVAASFTDSSKIKTDVDKLSLALQIMSETLPSGQKEGKGIFWKTYAPFFIEMRHKKLLETFAHIASITSGNEENIKWINDNQDKLKGFYEWLDKYEWVR